MGEFLQHDGCPQCGSKDNVGVWTDGKYCFGCGWVEQIDKVTRYKNRRESKLVTNDSGIAFLPVCRPEIPEEPMKWIKQYGIRDSQIVNNQIKWSESRQLLIFPIYDSTEQLRGWNGRQFGPEKAVRKYDSRGNLASLDVFIPPETGNYDPATLVITEGYVDALKVSNVVQAMPLFGVSLSPERIMRLAHKIKRLTLWLDYDKLSHMVFLKKKYQAWFDVFTIVATKEDPKSLTEEEITAKLLESLD